MRVVTHLVATRKLLEGEQMAVKEVLLRQTGFSRQKPVCRQQFFDQTKPGENKTNEYFTH